MTCGSGRVPRDSLAQEEKKEEEEEEEEEVTRLFTFPHRLDRLAPSQTH